MTFIFIQPRGQHSFSNGHHHHLPTKIPFLFFINHLDALPPSNIFLLRDEHLWRQQFHWQLRHYSSSLRIMIGSFVVVFLLCFPVVVHSNNGNNPLAHHLTPTWRNRLVGIKYSFVVGMTLFDRDLLPPWVDLALMVLLDTSSHSNRLSKGLN